MSMKQTLTRIFNPETPNYIGEFVEGKSLNGIIYEGTIVDTKGEGIYVIKTSNSYRYLVRDIKRRKF